MNDYYPYDLRTKHTLFRILVIGRANAGKTTLLQRVCNTTEDPCISGDDNKNLVSVHRPEDEFCFWYFQPASTYLSGTTLTIDILAYLTSPISARHTRYQSVDLIQEQPQTYLPWFSWIWVWRQEATAGSPVVYWEEIKVDWSRRSAACYLVSFAISSYILDTDDEFYCERFCITLNNGRPLFPMETDFFEMGMAGKGFYHLIFQAFTYWHFPSTRHRDLYQIWWSDDSDLWHRWRW